MLITLSESALCDRDFLFFRATKLSILFYAMRKISDFIFVAKANVPIFAAWEHFI